MFAKRFEIRGDALDDPEIGRVADVAGGGPGFLKQLVDRFVVERGNVAFTVFIIVAGKEVGLTVGVEVDAERFRDSWLAGLERRDVIVFVAMIEDAKRPVPLARLAFASK